MEEMQSQTGQTVANLELGEEKRRSKEATLARLRDELAAAKVDISHFHHSN